MPPTDSWLRSGVVFCFNSDPVPKMKTHSGAKKRFRKTGTGKLRGRRAYSSHILEKKSPKRKRNMAKPVEISPHDAPTVRKLLGGK
jgi:large subunit ribosomal protein L35